MSTATRMIEQGIGPWALSADGTELIRGTTSPAGRWPRQSGSWSQEPRIPLAPRKPCRAVLVGESVARGFLLDPVVTLADLCHEALDRSGQQDRVELVDLAANNLAPDQALDLCRAAAELQASVIVLYAGNNFLRSTPWLAPDTRSRTAQIFREGGYAAYLAARRQAVADAAESFCRDVRRVAAQTGVKVVVVLPAVNLLDWQSPWVVPSWLPEGRLAAWSAARARLDAMPEPTAGPGSSAAAQEEAEARLELAELLVRLDGETTPRPLEIAGRCLVELGQPDKGLELLNRALSLGADPANYDRRCPPEVSRHLRQLGAIPGFSLVDVPSRLQARFGVQAFSRDVFLDYCHHTQDSLRLVADDIAAAILSCAGITEPAETGGHGGKNGQNERRARAGQSRAAAAGRAESGAAAPHLADGYLLSALHNQHWGQCAGIVRHWISQAARTDPRAGDTLATYFAASRPDARFWLAGQQLAAQSPRLYWFLRNFSHHAVLDAEFARRALRALDAPSAAALRAVLGRMRSGLQVENAGGDGLSLLEPYWRERDGPPQEETVFTSERGPVTRYGFLTTARVPLRLDAVLAVGPGLPGGHFGIMLNDAPMHEGDMTPQWSSHEVPLPPAALRPGANELCFTWPAGSRDAEWIAETMRTLGTGPESHPLARIARLRLRAA